MAKSWYGITTDDKKIIGCLRLTKTQTAKLISLGVIAEKLSDKKEALSWEEKYLKENYKSSEGFISVFDFEKKQSIILENINFSISNNFIPKIDWKKSNQKPKILLQKHTKNMLMNNEKSVTKKETQKEEKTTTNVKVIPLQHFIELEDLFKVSSSLVVYTDGSFHLDENGNSQLNGMFVINDNQKINSFSFEVKKSLVNKLLVKNYSPNDLAEMSAVDGALEYLKSKGKQNEEITLVVDNTTVIFMINEGMKMTEEIKDDLLLKHVIDLIRDFSNLKIKWCKGHSKNLGNVIADKIIKCDKKD